eukprot:5328287-Amphidinium_carterae.1
MCAHACPQCLCTSGVLHSCSRRQFARASSLDAKSKLQQNAYRLLEMSTSLQASAMAKEATGEQLKWRWLMCVTNWVSQSIQQ